MSTKSYERINSGADIGISIVHLRERIEATLNDPNVHSCRKIMMSDREYNNLLLESARLTAAIANIRVWGM